MESLVVEIDDAAYADRFRAAAERTIGAPSSIVQRSTHVTVLELRAPDPERHLLGAAPISLVTQERAGSGPLHRSRHPTTDSAPHGWRWDVAAADAEPIDVVRLLGPALRGRAAVSDLPVLIGRYLDFQSLAARLRDRRAEMDDVLRSQPALADWIRLDLSSPDVLDRWGTSSVLEDGEGLVPEPVVAYFAEHLHGSPEPNTCHAGLIHTYGYILSPVATQFGRKRHRWTSQEVAHTLDLPGSWPLDRPEGILSALTDLLETVAPLDRSPRRENPAGSAPAMVLDERVEHGTENGVSWRSRTRFLQRESIRGVSPTDGDELLLVYSLAAGDAPERYITAFPVSGSFYRQRLHDTEHRLRYNAVIA